MGRTLTTVGRLLATLSARHQVLCVTHLAQVAAHAHAQWRITKAGGAGGVRAGVEVLDADERVEEIARMLGGMEITATTRKHAREMLAG